MIESHNVTWYKDILKEFKAGRKSNLSSLICAAEKYSQYKLGGQAYRNWYAGLYIKGVYYYSNNHKIGILITPHPDADPVTNCTDSCVGYGKAKPSTTQGEFIPVPNQLKEKVDSIIRDYHNIEIINVIEKRIGVVESEIEKKKISRKLEKEKILSNWEEI